MRVLIIGWASAAILFIFGVAFTYLTFRSAPRAVTPSAQSGEVPYSIVVGADGMASASPDVAYVSLGVDTPARTAEE
ncbi:MAG: hypothetical protein ACHQ7M_12435, partial [Chloroflexota bacterium]